MSSVSLVTIKYDVLYDIFFPLWGREALYIAVKFFYVFPTLLNMFIMKILPDLTFLFLGYLEGSLKNLRRITDFWILNLLLWESHSIQFLILLTCCLTWYDGILLSHLSAFKTDPHAFSPVSTFAIWKTGKIWPEWIKSIGKHFSSYLFCEIL